MEGPRFMTPVARVSPRSRRSRVPLLLLTALAASLAVFPPPANATVPGSTVGYLGCSPTWQTVEGYHADGGTRLWPTLMGYGAGEIPKWYADIGPSTKYWRIFKQALAAQPTDVFWFQACLLTDQVGRTNVRDAEAIVAHIRELVPGATVYMSAMTGMDPPDSCGKASAATVAHTQQIVDTAVADGVALRGPVMPALPSSMTSDPCHPDAAGEAFLGHTLLVWLGEAGSPAPTFTQTPLDPSGPAASFSFTDADASATFTCSLDGATATTCASPQDLTGLTDGPHTFSVRAVDTAGNVSDPATFGWGVDATAPVVALVKPTADVFLNALKVTTSWAGSDDRGIARYVVSERIGTAGAQTVVQSSLATSFSRAGALGKTYCYQVSAYDAAGNVGTSDERCQAVPNDDTDPAITVAGSITRISSPNAFQRTLTVLNGAGQTASFTFAGRRVAVFVHKSPSSGKANISVDGATPTTVDLYAPSPKDGASVLNSVLSPGSHTVTITWTGQKNSASTGTEVDLDSIGVISQ
jgi:hypothetical protein